ncbi:MAG: STAS domain-containing protein [Candidatus Hydrogenedentes bacterium]|nr:STAS domain-containing protein [Candidatus Hydrogenedentota bacterium]
MQIAHERTDSVTMLFLTGRLDELAVSEVEAVFSDALNNEEQGLIVNLAGVEYISSSGLRVLLMLAKAMKKQQRTLKLCSLSPFVAEVFEISNFSAVFTICDDMSVARQGFGDAPDS